MKTDTISAALDMRPMYINLSCEEYITESVNAGEANAFYGLKHTKSSRKQMSIAAKSRPCNRKGVKLSAETRKKISENNTASRAFSTHVGIFKSKEEASKVLNVHWETLRNTLHNKLDIPISRCGRLWNKEHVGKTPRQLGWGYV